MNSKQPSPDAPGFGAGSGSSDTGETPPAAKSTRFTVSGESDDTDNAGLPPDIHTPVPAFKTQSQLGDYLLLKKIGSGAMGAVYRARHVPTDKVVALKVLFKHVAENPKLLERFHREAEVSRTLAHPNIVCGHGSGKEHRWHYIAMEYVDGQSLQKWLSDRGRFSLGDALHLVLRCAHALDYAHSRGMVHRDIKPDNILLTQDGQLKVADFGMVKRLDDDMSLTQTGHAVGTPWYMPLEQAKNAKDTDGRCDIYALGCMFYAMLTGQPPFTGPTLVDVIQAKENGNFPPARQFNKEVPERVDMIIAKMTAKLPKYRYQKCSDLATDLEGLGLANPTLTFLQPQPAGGSGTASDKGDVAASAAGQLLTPPEPAKAKLPHEDFWYIRYTRDSGKAVVQKLSAEQVLRLLETKNFDPKLMVSRSESEGFRAPATFKEFEKAALGRVTRQNADSQTPRQRRLFERIVQQQAEKEKPTRVPVTTTQYWFGIFLRVGLVAAAVGAVVFGAYFLFKKLAG